MIKCARARRRVRGIGEAKVPESERALDDANVSPRKKVLFEAGIPEEGPANLAVLLKIRRLTLPGPAYFSALPRCVSLRWLRLCARSRCRSYRASFFLCVFVSRE